MDHARYPIGRYTPPPEITAAQRAEWIEQLSSAPAELITAVEDLSESQLDTAYRPGGWTIRQVVHHVPDSHINSYIRFRLALTENAPTIKPYEESAWAELTDAKHAPIDASLLLLVALHQRWVTLLQSLSDEQFNRTFRHPEHGEVTLNWNLGLYAWHGRHHTAHIRNLREREGW